MSISSKYRLSNGLVLPIIGYGTFPQKESLLETLPIAISEGYTLIDTSDNYFNESYVGKALEENENGSVIVVTKNSDPYTNVRKSFELSRKKLNNFTDIYLLHWPFPFLWKRMWREMEALYANGECSAIGVCNFDEKKIKKLLKFCKIKPMINQIECHPDFQQRGLINLCRTNNIQIMSYSPLARMDKKLLENPVIMRLAEKHNKKPSQIILRWNIQEGLLPIPGASSALHVSENISIFDFDLSANDMREINMLDCGNRVRLDPNKCFTMKQKFWYFAYWLFKKEL